MLSRLPDKRVRRDDHNDGRNERDDDTQHAHGRTKREPEQADDDGKTSQ